MSGKKKTKGSASRSRPRPRPEKVSTDELVENAELRYAYQRLVEAVSAAQARAEQRTQGMHGVSPNDLIDLTHAGRILDQYPQLGRYLQENQARAAAREEAMSTKASPTGYPGNAARGDLSPIGGWAGIGASSGTLGANAQTVGVHNARQLRDWFERDEWINAGINFLAQKVSRADVATLPDDERKPYNRNVLKSVDLILDQPNELRDTWPMIAGQWTRDLLTLGQGCFTKNMTPRRQPVAIYSEDAANFRIYSAWSGDADEPRYLYQENAGIFGLAGGPSKAVPLRNDEAIVVPWNPSSYRFGLGPLQVLADTIDADLRATQAAAHLVDFHSPPHLVDIQGASPLQINTLRSTYENEVMGRREILFTGSPNGARVYPLVFSAKDQQWLEWQVYLARKICAVLQVSPQDLGITFDINKSTAGVQMEISESKGFLPLLLLLEEYLNREFLADFAPKLPMGRSNLQALNLRVIFPEISEAARQLHAQQAVQLASQGLAGLPSMTLNQVLMMMGQEPVRGGNTFWTFTQTNGPLPWLSYDNDFGSWVPPLGTQDAAGGPDSSGAGVQADDTGDDGGVDATQDSNAAGPGESGGSASDSGTSPSGGSGSPTASPGGESGGGASGGPAAPSGGGESGGGGGGAATASLPPSLVLTKDDNPGGGNHTGIMVAFFLDPGSAEKLAIEGGEKPEDLHVTLAYLGDIRSTGTMGADINALKQTLAQTAARYAPLSGSVAGLGRFNGDEASGGMTPVWASVDVPGLVELRVELVKALAAAGWESASSHGYTPHITLAYIDAEDPMPVDQVPALPLAFDQLVLAWGDERIGFPLLGSGQAAQSQSWALPVMATHKEDAMPVFSSSFKPDLRRPGRAWSPSTATRTAMATWGLGLATHAHAGPGPGPAHSGSHEDEQAARAALAAAVTRVFADVAARGHAHAEHAKERMG